MKKHILITGASGLIGTRLTELLLKNGYAVSHVGRSRRVDKVQSFVWDVRKHVIEPGAFKGITTVVHLAGAGVAEKRWSAERKKEILESRTKSSNLLYDELKKGHHHVTAVISASAIGYYGINDNEVVYTEDSPAGNDFLADVTRQWEESIDKIKSLGIRVAKMRIGIVLSNKGGTLKELEKPIKLLAGAPLGSGKQEVSWVHIDDVCGMFIKAIEDDSMSGPYNAVGPYPVTNQELTKEIAHVLKKPLVLPNIPGFILKMIVGPMAEIVLTGSKVSSEKIQTAGYVLQYQTLNQALTNLYKK